MKIKGDVIHSGTAKESTVPTKILISRIKAHVELIAALISGILIFNNPDNG